MAIKAELEAFSRELEAEVGDDAQRLFDGQIEQARRDGVPGRSLKVGSKAPNFSLPGATGEPVELRQLLQKGRIVLTFYRGGWCPYCNIQLRSYQGIADRLRKFGASLVAISPETPDNSIATKDREKLEFPVLSDKGNAVARQFGLVFPVSADVIAIFKDRWDLDLEKENGVEGGELPVPGTFVIDRDGTIVFAKADVDYRTRVEPEELLEALSQLS